MWSETSDTVPKKGVSRVGGIASQDLSLCHVADESLTVGVDRAREVSVREDLQSPCYGKEFHEGGGSALVGVKSLRGEGEYDDGVMCPVPIGGHNDKTAPPAVTIPHGEVVVVVRGRAGFPGAVGVEAPVLALVEEGADGVRPVGAGGDGDLEGVREMCEYSLALPPPPLKTGPALPDHAPPRTTLHVTTISPCSPRTPRSHQPSCPGGRLCRIPGLAEMHNGGGHC